MAPWSQPKASPGFPDARLLRSNRRDDLALGAVMGSEDIDIRDDDRGRDPHRRRGLPLWPLLVVLGLLAVAAGVIGPLLQG
jgi:hypothetical protein